MDFVPNDFLDVENERFAEKFIVSFMVLLKGYFPLNLFFGHFS